MAFVKQTNSVIGIEMLQNMGVVDSVENAGLVRQTKRDVVFGNGAIRGLQIHICPRLMITLAAANVQKSWCLIVVGDIHGAVYVGLLRFVC